MIFTSSLESVLVKFKEFFIYLFLYLSSVILKIHYSFRFNFRFFVKFYANIRTSDRVIAVKPNLKWRPPHLEFTCDINFGHMAFFSCICLYCYAYAYVRGPLSELIASC